MRSEVFQRLALSGMLLVAACSESPLESDTSIDSSAVLSVQTIAPSGLQTGFQRRVRSIEGAAGQVTTSAMTDSAVQVRVRARDTRDAPAGVFLKDQQSPEGVPSQIRLSRSTPGAPYSRVEVREGGALKLVVASDWKLRDGEFVLESRTYERYEAGGSVTRSRIAFDSPTSLTSRLSASWAVSPTGMSTSLTSSLPSSSPSSVLPSVLLEEGCGDEGVDYLPGGNAVARFAEETGCGCYFKFVAMTGAGLAASAFIGAGVMGLIGTWLSGGILLPAEMGIIGGYFLAEALFVERTEKWLDCINGVQ
jgi:hypothetical protein